MTKPTQNQQTLFQELTAAGCEIDNHESDLFVKDSTISRSIIKSYRLRVGNNHHCVLFRSTTDDAMWWEVPFAYDPFWSNNAVLKPET